MGKDRGWMAPLTGLVFLVLVVLSFLVSGEEPPNPTDDTAREIANFYSDNEGSQTGSAVLAAFAATFFVFFAGTLRGALRDAEGPGGVLSAVSFGGAIIFATGVALDSTITFALVDTADDISPAAVQALSALWNNDFIVFAVGIQIFLLATGISLVRHAALPRWVGWIAIILAIIAVTPAGFAAFIGSALLVAVMSVMLALRKKGESAAGPPPAAA